MGAERRQGGGVLSGRIPVVVDSDLGSDPDDELTLAFIWGSPELALSRLVVSYGDVAVRAAIAARMGALVGRDVPLALGAATPRSGATVWWAGHEGVAYGIRRDAASIEVAGTGAASTGVASTGAASAGVASTAQPADGVDAVAAAAGGELLAIAPLTTVADALDTHPGIAPTVRITIMGGDFRPDAAPEHNIASDVAAARAVFASDTPIRVVGVDVTRQVRLHRPAIARIAASGPLGAVLGVEIDDWLARWSEDFEVPHDPVAALTIVAPELFEFSPPGRVHVHDDGSCRFTPGDGSTTIALRVVAPRAANAVLERVLAGLLPVTDRTQADASSRHEGKVCR